MDAGHEVCKFRKFWSLVTTIRRALLVKKKMKRRGKE